MTFQSNSTTIQNGYYSLLADFAENPTNIIEPLSTKKPISLTDPSNVFQLDNIVSDRLNQFQTKYSRYLQCQGTSQTSVSDPPCGDQDSFDNVEMAYKSLLGAIRDVSNSFATQKYTGAKTPQQYNDDYAALIQQYAEVRALRAKLDQDLYELQVEKNKGPNTSIARFESAVYINTLWIILATILIYFIFVGF